MESLTMHSLSSCLGFRHRGGTFHSRYFMRNSIFIFLPFESCHVFCNLFLQLFPWGLDVLTAPEISPLGSKAEWKDIAVIRLADEEHIVHVPRRRQAVVTIIIGVAVDFFHRAVVQTLLVLEIELANTFRPHYLEAGIVMRFSQLLDRLAGICAMHIVGHARNYRAIE